MTRTDSELVENILYNIVRGQQSLDLLILRTPTSRFREKLTAANIHLLTAMEMIKGAHRERIIEEEELAPTESMAPPETPIGYTPMPYEPPPAPPEAPPAPAPEPAIVSGGGGSYGGGGASGDYGGDSGSSSGGDSSGGGSSGGSD